MVKILVSSYPVISPSQQDYQHLLACEQYLLTDAVVSSIVFWVKNEGNVIVETVTISLHNII